MDVDRQSPEDPTHILVEHNEVGAAKEAPWYDAEEKVKVVVF